MPSFSKNAILVGTVDHFCLVCEAHLKSEEDVFPHIRKAVHKKSLDATQYVESYKKDRIRKVKNGYFCEFCNILMATLAKVRLHVEAQTHVRNSNDLSLKRVGKDIIAFDDIAINERVWNGLQDNSCAVCNSEHEDENIHKTQTTHVLNLVQMSVAFDKGNNIYRKMDETTFHCLTCDKVLLLGSMSAHWNTAEHKNKYATCRDAKQSVCVTTENSSTRVELDNKKIKTSTTDSKILKESESKINTDGSQRVANESVTNNVVDKSKDKIFESLSRLQDNGMLINFETETAHCKKCASSLNLDFEAIEEHIKNHNEKKLKKTASKHPKIVMVDDTGDGKSLYTTPIMLHRKDSDKLKKISKSDKESIENLAESNNMECNSNNGIIICKTCNNKIPYSLKTLKEHISSNSHKKTLQKQNQRSSRKELKKISTREFIKNIFDSDSEITSDIIINEEICIPYLSYTTIIEMRNGYFSCQSCEEYFIIYELTQHMHSVKHRALEECFVVTELNTEFIRELHRGVFHCAYCNLVVATWENMELHLKTVEHTLSKKKCTSKLQQHAAKLEQHKMLTKFEQIMRMQLLLNM